MSPYVPCTIHELTLPSGTRLRTAISALRDVDPIMAERWRTWLKNPGYFDAGGDVDPANLSATELTYADAPHAALRVTWLLRGVLWSAGREG
ncbi:MULTISPECIES: hypothetical protein [Sorangium]|uniref:hypothetical protein n=1 Tax=Sorangium TaxID=39643 RepID=UPI003D9C237D